MANKYGLPFYRFTGNKYSKHATAIGQLALAWNFLHELLGVLFLTILEKESEDQQYWAIWHAATFDRPKRELLIAAASKLTPAQKTKFPKVEADLKWLLDRTNALEDERNNAVHAPLLYVADTAQAKAEGRTPYVAPVGIFGNRRALKLYTKENLIFEYKHARDSAAVLSKFTTDMERALRADATLPWPKRPSLPNRGHKKSRRGQPRLPHTE